MRHGFQAELLFVLLSLGAGVLVLPVQAAEVCVVCEGPAAQYRCAFAGDAGPAPDPRLAFTCLNEISKSGGHRLCAIARNSTAPCQGILKTIARPQSEAPVYVEVPVKEAPTHGTFNDKGEAEITSDQFKSGRAATPEAVPDTSPETARQTAPGNPDERRSSHEAKVAKPEGGGEAQPKEAQPKTVKELVDQGAASTGKSIATAGEAAGKAAGSAAQSAGSVFSKAGSAVSKAGSAVSSAATKTWTCLKSFFGECKLSSD